MNFLNFFKLNRDPDEAIIKSTIANLKRNQDDDRLGMVH